jgi:hypothetical protein
MINGLEQTVASYASHLNSLRVYGQIEILVTRRIPQDIIELVIVAVSPTARWTAVDHPQAKERNDKITKYSSILSIAVACQSSEAAHSTRSFPKGIPKVLVTWWFRLRKGTLGQKRQLFTHSQWSHQQIACPTIGKHSLHSQIQLIIAFQSQKYCKAKPFQFFPQKNTGIIVE